MSLSETAVSNDLRDAFTNIRRFSPAERLLLARWLLDSVLDSEDEDESDWNALSLVSFEADWDNPEDAIYDEWRIRYDVPEG